MIKPLLATLVAVALAACNTMPDRTSAGNPAETKNSTDANKSRNPAAVSPGGGAAAGTGAAGSGSGSGAGGGTGAGSGAR